MKPDKIPIQTFDMSTAALEALFPVNNHGWVVLDRTLDPDVLRQAVIGVLQEFPALASGIRPGWLRSRYVPVKSLAPPLEVVDHTHTDPCSLPEPLLEFFRTPLDMYRGPLAAFCLIRAKGPAFLGVNVHHGAGDGRGLRHLLAALAEHYSALSAGKDPGRPQFRTDRVVNIIYRQYSLRRRISMVVQAIKIFGSIFRSPLPDTLEAPTAGPGTFTPVFFTGDESADIIGKSRSLGITVNDLFIAALARSYRRWNKRIGTLRFMIPQDLRPWGVEAPGAHLEEGEWRTVGNVLGGFFFGIPGSEMEDPDRLRMLVRERTLAEKRAESALAFASLAILPVNLFPMKPCMSLYRRLNAGGVMQKILRTSTVFSNLGTVPSRQLRFAGSNPIHFAFALPYIEGLGPLFTAAGVGDSISLVISHPEELDKEKLIALFKEEVFR